MPKHPTKQPTIEDAIRLNELATATLVFINHLPEIDPASIPVHVRTGFLNSISRMHDTIHDFKARCEAVTTNQQAA